MDQPPAVAFIAFADVWPRATGNGDRRRLMRHWRGKEFDFFLLKHRIVRVLVAFYLQQFFSRMEKGKIFDSRGTGSYSVRCVNLCNFCATILLVIFMLH